VQQNPRFEETCVNRPYAPSDEHEVVMAPTLQKEHRVDDSGRFLTYLFFLEKNYKSSTTILIVVSYIGPQRMKRESYMKVTPRMMRTMYGPITSNV
jgi:hypothetical protein